MSGRALICLGRRTVRNDESQHRGGGNMTEAAARLGLERSHLYKKLKRLGGLAEG